MKQNTYMEIATNTMVITCVKKLALFLTVNKWETAVERVFGSHWKSGRKTLVYTFNLGQFLQINVIIL